MKIVIYMKTPDAVDFALENEVPDEQREDAKEVLKKWFLWGETLRVEVDLEKKTIKVLEN